MQPFEQATARQRAYHELSQIFLYGITGQSLAFLEKVLPDEILVHLTKDVELLAAEYYQLFGLNVFPYASIFLYGDTMLGTPVTDSVQTFYHEVGFTDYANDMPDHIGNAFALLSFLSGAEADALEDNVLGEAYRMQHLQRRFLEEHILGWLPALSKAIQQQDSTLYSYLMELGLSIAVAQYRSMRVNLIGTAVEFCLPDAPQLLDNEKTSLKDIAEYLLVPAFAGFYLSRDVVRQLGHEYDLPHGFGKRHQLLTNLFRTAVDYDLLVEVIQRLRAICTDWQEYYRRLAVEPALEKFTRIWLERLQQTDSILETMTEAIQTRTVIEE